MRVLPARKILPQPRLHPLLIPLPPSHLQCNPVNPPILSCMSGAPLRLEQASPSRRKGHSGDAP
jgi:hypothetical protein